MTVGCHRLESYDACLRISDSRLKRAMPHSEGPKAKRIRRNRTDSATRDTLSRSEQSASPSGCSSELACSPQRSDTARRVATNQPCGEGLAEEDLNGRNKPQQSLNQGSSQLENLDSFVDFNHELFQDFDPVQDIELFKDFDPVQDIELFQGFHASGDIHLSRFNAPDLSTSEASPEIPVPVSTAC